MCAISNDALDHEVGVNRQREDCLGLVAALWPEARVTIYIDNDLSAPDPRVIHRGK